MQNELSATRNACTRLALLAIGLFFAVAAHADPAGRIGRIAWLSDADAVNLYNAESGESYNAPLNQPLTSGDILTTTAGSRAEIRIGSMTVRLDANSELTLDRIDDKQVQLYLSDGTAIVKLSARDTVDDFELSSPDGRFTARATGIYRFDVDANSSRATTYYGALNYSDRVNDRDITLDIGASQSAQFGNTGRDPYRLSSAFSDDFSRWSADRDRRAPSTTYTRYVSPEMTGADELDNYGDWSETPEYGAIWTPRRVDPDWVPYRTGHWVWVAPWGWNWVGNEPWGFAPFHYGRWVQHRGHWGWIPGTRVLRPVYSPAMVAWVGSPGLNVSISIGNRPNVGWFPLAPREVYVPSYHTSAVYIRNVNITHVTHINNVDRIVSNPQGAIQDMHYRHREMPQALTTVSADVITHRSPVESAMQADNDRHDRGNRGDHRAPPMLTVAPQVARPAPTNDAPPRPERSRPERFDRADRGFPRREARPEATRTDSPALAATPQRNNGPRPEIQRPMPPRPEVVEPRGQTPAPASVQVETRAPQVRQDQRPDQRLDRDSPRRDRREPPNTEPPVTSGSPAPVVIAPRGERPQPDIQRPIPPKPEAPDSRSQAPAPLVRPEQAPPAPVAMPPRAERPERAERPMPEVSRPAQRPAPTEMHVAPAPQQIQPPPPARTEAPANAREPRHDGAREDKRPPVDEEELKRRRRHAEENR